MMRPMSDVQAIMLPPIHGVIQALVWITASGLLYLVCLQSCRGWDSFDFDWRLYAQQVIGVLQLLWALLAFSLILTLLFVASPIANQSQIPGQSDRAYTGLPLVSVTTCGESHRWKDSVRSDRAEIGLPLVPLATSCGESAGTGAALH